VAVAMTLGGWLLVERAGRGRAVSVARERAGSA